MAGRGHPAMSRSRAHLSAIHRSMERPAVAGLASGSCLGLRTSLVSEPGFASEKALDLTGDSNESCDKQAIQNVV